MTRNQDGSSWFKVWINAKVAPVDQYRLLFSYSTILEGKVYTAQSATPALAQEAANFAWSAFLDWNHTSYTRRCDLLLRAADIYEWPEDNSIKFERDETSCSETHARFNIRLAYTCIREIASDISEPRYLRGMSWGAVALAEQ
jgi:acyl-CoA reductase-like NAD-dependent aldehyde dehydrogenase